MPYSERWKLENIFKGGSASSEFYLFLNHLKALLKLLEDSKTIKKTIALWQEISERVMEADSFVGCLLAQDVHDQQAKQLESSLSEIKAQFEIATCLLETALHKISEKDFTDLLQDPEMDPIAFSLQEKRQRAIDKLPPYQEALISDLSVDGYHGWSQLYNTMIGQASIPFQEKGVTKELSWGQAYNQLSNPNREVRKQVFENSNAVWKQNQNLYGHVFNHISGFRLKFYQHRKWEFLKEPLDINRMSKDTLETMWDVIARNKNPFIQYLKTKAKLLGLEKLHWYDLEAPLRLDLKDESISYRDAAHFIISHFSSFSPKMGAFAKKAFDEGWIEAEDRLGKRPGGFCTGFPLKKESRIFMTYANTKESLFTLAHELGHAYHNEVIFDLPEMCRHFPMNLAETASTFAEMIISEAALQNETDPKRKLWLLDAKLQRSVIFLCNIQARFIFEKSVYQERKKGSCSPAFLCEAMERAQKEAYGDSLEEYHPYFWISKMHFNLTEIPFYNFPYTFGYLFSLGIYLKALKEKNFENKYRDILADTGRMSAEQLAMHHLGVDLRQENFWQETLNFLKRDASLFQASLL